MLTVKPHHTIRVMSNTSYHDSKLLSQVLTVENSVVVWTSANMKVTFLQYCDIAIDAILLCFLNTGNSFQGMSKPSFQIWKLLLMATK